MGSILKMCINFKRTENYKMVSKWLNDQLDQEF